HHAATERRIQPFVAAGRQEIDSELRTVDGECAELLYGVDHEKELARLGEVGIGREIDSLTGNPADRAHQEGAGARVDRRAEVVDGRAPGTMRNESQLNVPLAAGVRRGELS